MSILLEPIVRVRKQGRAGIITLNRPKALHALTTEMCEIMVEALDRWRHDSQVELVLVEADPATKGFCAGGDIKMLAESGAGTGQEARKFFETEYRLNALIQCYPKPYVALMDGVTMGGGVGISVHGSHRIATERTVFAMPETGIGLFPDVGATWFLPRLEGELGLWLGLTGERLKGKDVLAVGIATQFVASNQLDELKQNLIKNGLSALSQCECDAEFSLAHKVEELNRCFQMKSVRGIVNQLSRGSPWAQSQARKINAKSPLSLCITYKQLRIGRYLDAFQAAMMLEYRIATRLISSHDFREGVRAVVVDKDHLPNWRPAHLFRVSSEFVDSYFSPLGDSELNFQNMDLS
nr:enoyl-CoA hydratase/isomerase family protein [Hyphomonas sp. Mor2]